MRHVLITAGCVYGKLDDNKLVGNRIRGIWATKFACWLAQRGYSITLLLPDIFDKASLEKTMRESFPVVILPNEPRPTFFNVLYHDGYQSYADRCYELAPKADAAVMAAAVVNWIPKEPFKGKMPTEGFKEGDVQNIPFILAPRVIDRMRKLNSKLTLIACKMTSGATPEHTVEAAYKTLEGARCHAVVANDLKHLKDKTLVYPDGSQFTYGGQFGALYEELKAIIDDQHYRTEAEYSPNVPVPSPSEVADARSRMARIIERYRSRFQHPFDGMTRVFGSIAVRVGSSYLVSPREKEQMWTADEAVLVTHFKQGTVYTRDGSKASLNAPLMMRHLDQFKDRSQAVLHLHGPVLESAAIEKHAPPGTYRDNDRIIPAPRYNIEGHGFIVSLDDNNEFIH